MGSRPIECYRRLRWAGGHRSRIVELDLRTATGETSVRTTAYVSFIRRWFMEFLGYYSEDRGRGAGLVCGFVPFFCFETSVFIYLCRVCMDLCVFCRQMYAQKVSTCALI